MSSYIRVCSINDVMLTLILLNVLSLFRKFLYKMFYLYVSVLTIYNNTVLFDLLILCHLFLSESDNKLNRTF